MIAATIKEDNEGVRDAVGASGGDPFERRKALAELKSGGPVVGVPARDAAIDQEAAEGHDEGLQIHARDEKPMHPAKDHAETDDDENGKEPGHVIVHEQVDEDDAEQGELRADRKVDAAGYDDEAFADREQAEQPDEIGGIRQIDRRDEARVEERHHGADDDDEQEKPEIFLQHHAALCSGPRATASRITFSSLNWSRFSVPLIAPSCITTMRSLTPITSSMSEEIIKMATPASASAAHQRIDFGL